jgi:hypothetical protein
MNYQNFASYNNIPPAYGKEPTAFYDRGSGVPPIDENNMTIQDIYRTPFLFIQDHRKNYGNVANTALKGIQTDSELSKLFFSDENFKRIQRMIREEIFKRTRGEFRLDVDQDQKDMFLVMRAIYLEHARYLPSQCVRQCKRLNQKVVEEVIPGTLTNIRQDYGYLKEINKPLSPIPRPISVNGAGRRALPSPTITFGL